VIRGAAPGIPLASDPRTTRPPDDAGPAVSYGRFVTAAIEVRGLRKSYGRTVAVDELSFSVRPGEVTGFVGPNGSGKSTTMRVVLGLDRPDAGEALVDGRPYRSLDRPLLVLGALLDAGAVHPGRRARDHLRWIAQSNGLAPGRVDEVLEMVGLASAARRRGGDLSLGMSQRLGLAAALLGDPPTLMLDEPVNGLDPEGIGWIRGLLRGFAAEGRAVLLSSHLMSELEGTADRVVVIGRGRLIADATVEEMVANASRERVEVRTVQKAEAMTALADTPGVTVAAVDHDLVTVTGLDGAAVARVLTGAGVTFSELRRHRASLEAAYMELTRGQLEFAAAEPGGDDHWDDGADGRRVRL
jgi:ABC-2 type transport system ATP-binding protein